MATVEENRHYWEEIYAWPEQGEEWSRGWGGTDRLWRHSLLPRVERFLPANTILEVAPGHGRFTPHLASLAQRYIGVDLAPHCVEVCREKFPELSFHPNDGRTLPMLKDRCVDFVFSFFSLIHADIPTLTSYLTEFARILSDDGAGFIHHSNLAQHASYFRKVSKLPKKLQNLLFEAGLVDLAQWREPTVSAEIVKTLAEKAGLKVLAQETVNFGSRRTIDAFTTFALPQGRWKDVTPEFKENPGLMHEAMKIRLGR